jgi:S-adenosylmethionine:tRNA ribosyltransferase-isomerase
MKAATQSRPRNERRLLLLDRATGTVGDAMLDDLPSLLQAGDLLVVNDAATLPASLPGDGIEARLVRSRDDGRRWQIVLFGAGDWRTPTERRAAPPVFTPGAILRLAGLTATVIEVSHLSARLVEIVFDASADEVWSAIYRAGRPIQYAHLVAPIALWSVQTAFAARPWAVEAPSAGAQLDWSLLSALRARGVELTAITEGAGLSSTGDAALDAALPLPERVEVTLEAISAIERTRARGGRVVAVGTSVVRALESAAASGTLRPTSGETSLLIGPGYRTRVCDGIFTGLHEPTASHYALLQAFAARTQLDALYAHAERGHYLGHELGDSNLIL